MATYPSFSKKDSAYIIDFGVVGAGVFGLSAAYHIKSEYPTVILFDSLLTFRCK